MAMDSFNELLHKLKVLHERELEGWQEKVLELTNQKCCDTKRMEELFNKNQQLREQQRTLTENIKQLENRLRAGLCDRCTVTQDVAKRKQQEYESSQIQSLQHISVLVSEMNALKKENKRLQEEVKSLRGIIEGQNGHSSQVSTPESGTPPIPAGEATKNCAQPQSGQIPTLAAVKADPDPVPFLSAEEKPQECRKPPAWTGQEPYVSNKLQAKCPPVSPGQRADITAPRGSSGVKRTRSMEAMEQYHPHNSPISPLLLLKGFHVPVSSSPSSSSSPASPWDEKIGTHLIQSPVIYRPRPIKTTRLSLPYPIIDHQEWAALANYERKRLGKEQFPGEGLDGHPGNWGRKRSPEPLLSAVQPLGQVLPPGDTQWKERTKEKEAAPLLLKCGSRTTDKRSEKNSTDAAGEAPLDLSDPRRSQPSEQPKVRKPTPSLPEEDPEGAGGSDKVSAIKAPPQAQTLPPSCGSALSSPSAAPAQAFPPTSPSQGPLPHSGGKDHQKQEQEEESNGGKEEKNSQLSPKEEQKKVPVLTISLRPVVVLETMKEGIETQESSDQEMPAALRPESRVDGTLDEDCSSPDRGQNGRRTRRGPAFGRDVLLRRSPKDRRGKLTLSQGDMES